MISLTYPKLGINKKSDKIFKSRYSMYKGNMHEIDHKYGLGLMNIIERCYDVARLTRFGREAFTCKPSK